MDLQFEKSLPIMVVRFLLTLNISGAKICKFCVWILTDLSLSSSWNVEVSSWQTIPETPSCILFIFLFFYLTMHHPYQSGVTELRINISIHDYCLFLLLHVGINSCKCIKFWLAFFNMLYIWPLNTSWSSILTTIINFCSKLLLILTPLISMLKLSEVTVREVFFLLTNRLHFSGLALCFFQILSTCHQNILPTV